MKSVRITQEMIDEYLTQGHWMSETLSDIWERNARLYPQKEAFVDQHKRLTWAQMEAGIDNLALHLLELGIQRNEVVVCQLPGWSEVIQLHLACEKAGIIFAGAILPFRHTEMEHILRITEAAAVVVPWKFRGFDYYGMVQELKPRLPALRHILVAGEDTPTGTSSVQPLLDTPPPGRDKHQLQGLAFAATETSNIGITSGTTGLPKCVEWSPAVMIYLSRVMGQRSGLTKNEATTLTITPLVAGMGFPTPFATALFSGRGVLMERFEAEEALQLIEKERVTFFMAVPAQIVMMLRHPQFHKYNLSSLQAIRVGGAPLPPELAMEAEKGFGCALLNCYGAADGGGFTIVPLGAPDEVRFYTTGNNYPGVEIKLVDEAGQPVAQGEVGEVLARGPACYPGYFKDTAAVLKAWGTMGKEGWFRTGDLGFFDGRGNLRLAGRQKDVIIRGGQNIYPAEIENLLLSHPKVLMAAVVGMPDPVMGEKACAYVVPRAGQDFSFEEMAGFLKENKIASFKLPERLEVVDSLPMSGDGLKVIKWELVRKLSEQLKAEGEL